MSAFAPTQLQQDEFFALAQTRYIAACIRRGVPVANLGSGSSLGPVFEGASQIATQLQAKTDTGAASSRILTIPENPDGTPNPDLDTALRPFGFTRGGGTFAVVPVNMGPTSPSPSILPIDVGTIVMRDDGVQYVVLQDTTGNPNFSLTASPFGSWLVPANSAPGATTIAVSCQCLQEGSIGNCDPGAITQFYSGPGVSAPQGIGIVTNANAVRNGIDGETDPDLKARFQQQGGLPKFGVRAAILSAVAKTQTGLIYQYGDYKNPDGTYHGAYFSVIVNNANSSVGPSPGLLAAVRANVDASRAGGIEFGVFAPTMIPVTVTGALTLLPGKSAGAVTAAALLAIQSYISGIGINADASGTTLSWGRVVAILDELRDVASVQNVLVNGGTSDLTAPFAQQFYFAAASAFTA